MSLYFGCDVLLHWILIIYLICDCLNLETINWIFSTAMELFLPYIALLLKHNWIHSFHFIFPRVFLQAPLLFLFLFMFEYKTLNLFFLWLNEKNALQILNFICLLFFNNAWRWWFSLFLSITQIWWMFFLCWCYFLCRLLN